MPMRKGGVCGVGLRVEGHKELREQADEFPSETPGASVAVDAV